MARENLEIVRRVLGAERQRDDAAIFALHDEEIEWDVSRVGGAMTGAGGILRGHEGVRTWFRTWYQGFDHVKYEMGELVDAGERVVAVSVVEWFLDRDEALEAVGLGG